MGVLTALVVDRVALSFDEAYNLNLIQTFAQEGLYATHLSTGYRLFDPAITTGPTLVAPLALATRVLGSGLSVVRGTMVVIFLLSLVLLFLAARSMFDGLTALGFVVVLFTTPLVLWTGVSVAGEIPAISLTCCAIALIDRADRSDSRHAASLLLLSQAGVLLGLAILAKDIMYLTVGAMVLTTGFELLNRERRAQGLRHSLPIAVALSITVAWRAYQFVAARGAGPEQAALWSASTRARSRLMLTRVIFDPLSHVRPAWASALGDFAPHLLSLVTVCLGVLLLRFVVRVPLPWAAWQTYTRRLLIAITALWLLWYFLLSGPEATSRHLLPGIVVGELLVVYSARWLWGTGSILRHAAHQEGGHPRIPWRERLGDTAGQHDWVRYPIAGAVTLLIVWAIVQGARWNQNYLSASERRLVVQSAVTTWVQENISADEPISGWGWFVPWDIAFLAKRVPSTADLDTGSLEGLSNWFVLIPEVAATGNLDSRLQNFLMHQGQPRYVDEGYEIYQVQWRPDGASSIPSPQRTLSARVRGIVGGYLWLAYLVLGAIGVLLTGAIVRRALPRRLRIRGR